MKITVIGTGYVGLVTGTCLAEVGNYVSCVDIDKEKVTNMHNGIIPIFENELEDIFKKNIDLNRLSFTSNLPEGIEDADIIFLALPTPSNDDGSADLSYVLAVARELGPLLSKYTVIVNKSTVPVGTAEEVTKTIQSSTDVEFDVVSNPEFLREGNAVSDFMKPDRIVVGTSSDKAIEVLRKLYRPFTNTGSPLLVMDVRSAELTKYAANTFLAAKISFMNEIANLSSLLGADVDNIKLGIGSDDRIGSKFLNAGIGFGGSCFPKDVQALQKTAADSNYQFKVLNAIIDVNDRQKHLLFEKVNAYYKGDLKGKTFALWGLAYKANTDDIREAPSIDLIKELIGAGAQVKAYDPKASENIKKLFTNESALTIVDEQYEALENADALLIVTEWSVFKEADTQKIKSKLISPTIFDGRNIFSLANLQGSGFYYESIGRPIVKP